MTRLRPTLRFWIVVFLIAAALGALTPRANARFSKENSLLADDDLQRFVGTYEFVAGKTLLIVLESDGLHARPKDLPPGTLIQQNVTGRFTLLEAPFVFQFVADRTGKITYLEMVRPDGQKQRFRRLIDPRTAAAPLRAIAVDAETSVNAHVYNGYERVKNADGKFKTETFTFGDGGFQDRAITNDKSIDSMSFEQIAQSIAPALHQQGYLSATNVETTELLIMVYWGTTAGKDHPAVIAEEMFDPTRHVFRDQVNRENARLLGYQEALKARSFIDPPGSLISSGTDLLLELEESRYWVALVALDFQTARTEKKIKPLWSIRYNLPSQGTHFTAALPQMTQFASNYFGRDSHGLINRFSNQPQGKVELGEQKVIGVEPQK